MMSESLVDILNEGANEHSALARVLRHVEDRQVSPHARDFYTAMKYDPAVVVRVRADLPDGRSAPVDCRYRNGAVEFTHEHRDVGIVGSKQFVADVRGAAEVRVILYHASQFDDEYQCPSCRALSADPESTFVEATNVLRVTCPECDAVDEIPQGSEPPREPHRDEVMTDGSTSTSGTDRIEKAEKIAKDLRGIMADAPTYDQFADDLDSIHADLEQAIEWERGRSVETDTDREEVA